jgi:vacuolar protein 8
LNLCKTADDADVLAVAIEALSSLATDSETAEQMMTKETSLQLVNVNAKTAAPHVKVQIAGALANLASTEDKARFLKDGALGLLIQLIQWTVDTKLLQRATLALSRLVVDETCRPEIITMANISSFIQVAQSSQDPEVLEYAALLLKASAVDAGENLYQQKGFTTLIERFVSVHEGNALEHAANALELLAKRSGNRPRLLGAGVVRMLIRVCKESSNAGVLKHSLAAVNRLCLEKEGVNQFLEEGIVRLLGALTDKSQSGTVLSSDDSTLLQQSVAETFSTLACLPACMKRLVSESASSALVSLCKCSSDEDTLTYAAAAMANLGTETDTRRELVHAGAAEVLSVLCQSTSTQVLASVASAVRNIAMGEEARERFVAGGAATRVLAMCDHEDMAVSANAAEALASLALHPEVQEEMSTGRAVTPLLRLLVSSPDAQVLENAITTIGEMILNDNSRAQIVLEDGVQTLLNLCTTTTGKTDSMLIKTCQALRNLCRYDSTRQQLADFRAGKMLVQLLKEGTEPVFTAAVGALANLSLNEQAGLDILGLNTFKKLQELCASSQDRELWANAAQCIANFSMHESGIKQVVPEGAIKLFVQVLNRSIDTSKENFALRSACAGLRNLSRVEKLREQMVDDGAVKPLVQVCSRSQDSIAVANSVAAISYMANYEKTKPQMILGGVAFCGGIGVLVQLCRLNSDLRVLTYAAKALANLALDSSSLPQLVQEGAVPPLVLLCSSAKDKQLLATVADALRNLARHEGTRPHLVQQGAVVPLVALTSSKEPQVAGNATAALANMALHEASAAEIVRAGAIKPLVEICTSCKDRAIILFASVALKNLTRDGKCRGKVIEGGAVKPLVDLWRELSDDKRILTNITDALINASMDDTHQERVVNDGAGSVLVELCYSTHTAIHAAHEAKEEISEKQVVSLARAIAGLRNLARHEPSRKQLVEDDMVEVISLICSQSKAKPVLAHATSAIGELAQDDSGQRRMVRKGVITNLVQLCSLVDDRQVFGNATMALAHVSALEEMQEQLVVEGALIPLVQLVSSTRDEEVIKLITLALAHLSSRPANRVELVKDGAADVLVKLIGDSDNTDVLRSTARALAYLTEDEATAQRVLDKSVAGSLVMLCRTSSDNRVLGQVAHTLANLSAIERNRKGLLAEGILLPMFKLCNISLDPVVLEYAASVLAHLSDTQELVEQIVESGAVQPLVQLCRISDQDIVVANAARALSHLAHLQKSRQMLIQEGAVQTIINLISSSVDENVRSHAAKVLAELTEECVALLSQQGGFQALIALCNSATSTESAANAASAVYKISTKENHRTQLMGLGVVQALVRLCEDEELSKEESVLQSAVLALHQLAESESCRCQMLIPDLISALVRVSKSSADVDVLEKSVMILAFLLSTAGFPLQSIDEGMIGMLVRQCHSSTSSEALNCIVEALASLSIKDEHRSLLIKQEAIPALTKILSTQFNESVLERAAHTLSNLCTSDGDMSGQILTGGAAGELVSLCRSSNNNSVLRHAVTALAKLTLHDGTRDALVEAQILPPLIKLCSTSPDPVVLQNSAGALANLAMSDTCRPKIVEAGVVAPMLVLLQKYKNADVLANAARIISNLAEDEKARQVLLKEEAVPAILGLFDGEMKDDQVLTNAAFALRNLARSPRVRQKIYQLGAVSSLVPYCSVNQTSSVAAHIAGLLANLCLVEKIRLLIIEEGIIRHLVDLISSSMDSLVLVTASGALRNLAVDDKTIQMVLEAGAIKPLASIYVNSTDSTVVRNAIGTVRNLARSEFTAAQLEQMGAIEPLFQYLSGDHEAILMATAAEALANLSKHTVAFNFIISNIGAIKALVDLCEDLSRKSVVEKASLALFTLSANPDSLEVLVSNNAIKQMVAACGGSKEPSVLRSSSGFLANVAAKDEYRKKILSLVGLEPLYSICAGSSDNATLTHAVKAIAYFASDEHSVDEIGTLKRLVPIVEVFKSTTEAAVLIQCACVLYNITNHQSKSVAEAVFETGIIPCLNTMSNTSDNDKLLEYTAGVIDNLSRDDTHLSTLAESVPSLLRICKRLQCDELLGHAATALSYLGANDDAAELLIEQGGSLKPLVTMLTVSQNERVVSSAASALGVLARNKVSRIQVLKNKAVKPLLQLASDSPSALIVRACIAALVEVCALEVAAVNKIPDGILALNGVAILVKICKSHTDDQSVANAAKALSKLALDKNLRPGLMEHDAFQPLLDRCHSSTTNVVLAAVADTIRNLARHEKYRTELMTIGASAALVKLCKEFSNNEVQANAAAALANISLSEVHRLKIVEDGGVQALILCCSPTKEGAVIGNAVVALRNLARSDCARKDIIELGGVRAMSAVSESESIDQKVIPNIVETFVSLSSNEATRKKLVEEGMITPLAKICDMTMKGPLIANAAAALAQLTMEEDNRLRIIDAGACHSFIKQTMISDDIAVIANCCSGLRHLALHPLGRQKLVQEGAVSSLAQLCTDHKTDPKIFGNSAMALAHLALLEGARGQLDASGAVDHLLELCKGSIDTIDASILDASLSAFASLSSSEDSSHSLLGSAVPLLIRTCKAAKNPTVLCLATEALANLAKGKAGAKILMTEDAATILLELCVQDGADVSVGTHATRALANIAAVGELVDDDRTKTKELVDTLMKFCNDPTKHPSLLKNATLALGQLAKVDYCKELIMQEGTFKMLINTCKERQIDSMDHATQLLAAFAEEPPAVIQMLADDAVVVLIGLITDSDVATSVQVNALRVILKASELEVGRHEIEKQSIKVFINVFAKVENRETCSVAGEILANLAVDSAIRKSILAEGALQPLIVSCRSPHSEVVSSATKAIRNLALDKESIPSVVKLGLVPTLRELCFTSDDSAIINNCVSIIRDLAKEESVATMLVQEGILRVLSNLITKQDNASVLHSLVQAMNQLCFDRNSRMLLASEETIEALVRLAKSTEETDAASRLTALVANLSAERENRKILIEMGVENEVVSMHSRCDDEALTEKSATVVLNLADCEDCKHEKFTGPSVTLAVKAFLHCPSLLAQSLAYLASAPSTADSIILGVDVPIAGEESTATKPLISSNASKIIPKLATILRQFETGDDVMTIDAAGLLKRHSLLEEGRTACINCGLGTTIIGMLSSSSAKMSNDVRRATTAVLTNLSCNDGSIVQFLDHDAIECLLTLTGHSDPKIGYNVTATMANLLRSKSVRDQFVENEGLIIYSSLLASKLGGEEDRTLTNVLHAYRVLTKYPDGTGHVSRDGSILEPLLAVIAMTGEDSTKLVQTGVEILARLAAEQRFRSIFIEADDGVPTLAKVVRTAHTNGSAGILKFATGVLARLAQDNLAKPKLTSHELVPTLVEMCGAKGDSTVIGYSALVLARLSTPSGELFGEMKSLVLTALQSVQKRFGKNVPSYLQGPLITAISVLK